MSGVSVDHWSEWAVIVLGVILLVLIVTLTFRGQIPTPWGAIVVGGKFRRAKKLPAHATCPHAADIMSVIAKTAQLTEARHAMKYDLVEIQMRYWEEKAHELESIFLKGVAGWLHDHNVHDPVQHTDYLSYQAILKVIFSRIKTLYRISMRKNHLITLNDTQWRDYKEAKVTSSIAIATEVLNTMYRGTILSRGELYKVNRSSATVRAITEIFSDTLDFALSEAKRFEKKEKEMVEEYNTRIKNTITG